MREKGERKKSSQQRNRRHKPTLWWRYGKSESEQSQSGSKQSVGLLVGRAIANNITIAKPSWHYTLYLSVLAENKLADSIAYNLSPVILRREQCTSCREIIV